MLWSFKKKKKIFENVVFRWQKEQKWDVTAPEKNNWVCQEVFLEYLCKKAMILPTKRVMHYLAKPNPDHQKCIFQTWFFFVLFFFSFAVSW